MTPNSTRRHWATAHRRGLNCVVVFVMTIGALLAMDLALAKGGGGMGGGGGRGGFKGGGSTGWSRGDVQVQEPGCLVTRIPLCDGCRLNASMRVTQGGTCHVTLRSGPVILANELTKPPAHGSYRTSTVSDGAYQPNPGYAGPDEFEFIVHRVHGQQARPVFVHIRVDVVQ